MIRCQICGRENEQTFRFCLDCGSDLAPPDTASAAPAAEAPPPGQPAPIKLTERAPPEPATRPPSVANVTPASLGVDVGSAPTAASSPAAAPTQAPPSEVATSSGGRVCPECGTLVEPKHLFCGACGTRVRVARTDPPDDGPTGTAMMPAQDARDLVQPRFCAIVIRPDGTESQRVTLGKPEMVAGAGGSDIAIEEDPFVAARHARLKLSGGELEVEDLSGATGTFLKVSAGERIRLKPGAAIRFGRQRLHVDALPPPPDTGDVEVWGSADPGYRIRIAQLLEGGGEGRVWLLEEGTHRIGRENGELAFPTDGFVSGNHGCITVGADGTAVFEDLGSSNGSFIRLAEPTRLKLGDLILVGMHLLRIEAA